MSAYLRNMGIVSAAILGMILLHATEIDQQNSTVGMGTAQIGDFIWQDSNGNGVQDGEPGIPNVNVDLYKSDGTLIGKTTTNGSGAYAFNVSNVDTIAPYGSGGFTGMSPNTSYYLVIGKSAGQFIQTDKILKVNGSRFALTLSNVGSDASDNDGSIYSGLTGGLSALNFYPGSIVTSPGDGASDNSFDYGFKLLPNCSKPFSPVYTKNTATCTNGIPNNNGSIILDAAFFATHIGVSTFNAPVYNGPTTLATAIPLAYPFTIGTNIPNSGGGYIIRIFNGDDFCYKDFAAVLPFTACKDSCVNTLGGTAWQDYNSDGIKQSNEKNGVQGVTVSIYDCTGALVATDVTDYYGKWHYDGAVAYPVRVEFANTNAETQKCVIPTFQGTNSATNVQFITGPSCTVDVGMQNPSDYCTTAARVIASCQVNGDTTATDPATVSYDYFNPFAVQKNTTTGLVGSVWGMAYNRQKHLSYSASFIKRHVSMGPGGGGAIYVTNQDLGGANASLFFDVASFESVGVIPSNVQRGLVGASKGQPNTDSLGFAAVGTVGLGDLDITDDDQYLYTVNLGLKRLVRIPTTSPSNANVKSWSIPDPGCIGGIWRPWAIGIHCGKVYVGGICDASIYGQRSDMHAYIYEFDPTTENFSLFLDYTLDYPRGNVGSNVCFQQDNLDVATHWNPWTSTYSSFKDCGQQDVYPTPIFSDIEFDVDGSLIMGYFDRWGHQTGESTNYPDGTFGEQGGPGGEILRAFNNNGTYQLELGGVVGPLEVSAASETYNSSATFAPNGQGFGGREFYYGDTWETIHDERCAGGLALIAGTGEVIMTSTDPNFSIYSGGVASLNNTTGMQNSGFALFSGGIATNGKAYGIGDVEVACDPAPNQIGNRVWIDADKDGVQDACESVIPGTSVKLYSEVGGVFTLVASTTTNANGQYQFKEEVTSIGYDTLKVGVKYFVVVGQGGDFNPVTGEMTVGANKYFIAAKDSGEGSNPDLNDSDGFINTNASSPFNGYPVDSFTITRPGYINHNIDFAFAPPVVLTPDTIYVSVPPNTSSLPLCGTGDDVSSVDSVQVKNHDANGMVLGGSFTIDANGCLIYHAGLLGANFIDTFCVFVYGPEGVDTTTYIISIPAIDCNIALIDAHEWPCNPETGKYILSGQFNVTNLPFGEKVIIYVDLIPKDTVVIGANPNNYFVDNLPVDGQMHNVVAKWFADTNCMSNMLRYNSPTCPMLRFGNQVWNDLNNNGQKDFSEPGIPNVIAQLWSVGANHAISGDDVLIMTDTTDAGGNYLFVDFPAGTYYVVLPGGGIPAGMVSSTGDGPMDMDGSGAFEPSIGSNNDVNNNDDGTLIGGKIQSDTMVLKHLTEPANDGDSDINSNLTVDFGFYTPTFACQLGTITSSPVVCNDNGTGMNTSDDTYTFPIRVDAGVATSATYHISGSITANNLSYGQSFTYGPFLISGGNKTITITDSADPNCTTTITIQAPAACSACPNLDCLPVKVKKN